MYPLYSFAFNICFQDTKPTKKLCYDFCILSTKKGYEKLIQFKEVNFYLGLLFTKTNEKGVGKS